MLLSFGTSASALVLNSSTDEWTAISLGGRSDFVTDTQANKSGGDIVGDAAGNQVGFYKQYDDGVDPNSGADDFIGFRVRLADATTSHVFIGMDVFDATDSVNNPDGAIDFYLKANFGNNNATNDEIDFFDPGDDSNISPATTSVSFFSTYKSGNDPDFSDFENLSPVSAENDSYLANNPTSATTDIDGGGSNDYFLSFQVNMVALSDNYQSIVAASTGTTPDPITADTAIQMILGTSTQQNSLNQDFGGSDPDDPNYDPNLTWSELGMASAVYTADGTSPVPEASSYPLLIGLVSLGIALNRRR